MHTAVDKDDLRSLIRDTDLYRGIAFSALIFIGIVRDIDEYLLHCNADLHHRFHRAGGGLELLLDELLNIGKCFYIGIHRDLIIL